MSVGEGLLEVDLVLFGGELDEAEQILRGRAGAHGAVEQGLGPVGDGLGGVEVVDAAEAVALGAGAVGGVEGEAAGLELGHVDAAVGAGHRGASRGSRSARRLGPWMPMRTRPLAICRALATEACEAAGVEVGRGGVGPCRRRGSGLRMMRSTMASTVWFLRFSRRMPSVELGHLAVDAGAEALLVEGFELFAELAFAAADDGGEDGDAFAGGGGCATICARRSGRRTGG